MPTWLFVVDYLQVWTVLGLVAYAAALDAEVLAARFDVLVRNVGLVAGMLIVVAGPSSSAG